MAGWNNVFKRTASRRTARRSPTHAPVLIRANWSLHWGTARYFDNSPFLTGARAGYLAKGGVPLVGIDSLSIDDTSDFTRPAHTILQRNGVLVLEHLTNLSRLPREGFELFAVPPN